MISQRSPPKWFETHGLDHGMIWRGFALQLRILAHLLMGGFLTYYSWNSVMKALRMGQPLIMLPRGSAKVGLIACLM